MSFSALENAAWNFDQTFKAIPGTAAEVEKKMREWYKLSDQTSKEMLSTAGDQLQAFGMGAEESLNKAKEIAERHRPCQLQGREPIMTESGYPVFGFKRTSGENLERHGKHD